MFGIRSLNHANASKFSKIRSLVLVKPSVASITNRGKIGNREVVGYGLNGHLCYSDQTDCPFPAIRFRESTPEILALREKERGDWRRLSIEEKKTLYRASFCQTFAEIDAPTGEWKSVIAIFGFCVSSALWLWVYTHVFVIIIIVFTGAAGFTISFHVALQFIISYLLVALADLLLAVTYIFMVARRVTIKRAAKRSYTSVHTKAPKTFSEERRAAQYWRQEAINNQPFSGNYKPPNADKYKPVGYVANVESP